MIGKRVRKPACPGLGLGTVVKRSRPGARVWWKVKWDALWKSRATTEHQNNLEVVNMRWVFYANSDWTETEINELLPHESPAAKHDTDGKQYSFIHVFEAADWDTALLQMKRLRYGSDGDRMPSDMERAKHLLRQMPSQAPEGSVNWSLAMNAVIHAFAGIRNE